MSEKLPQVSPESTGADPREHFDSDYAIIEQIRQELADKPIFSEFVRSRPECSPRLEKMLAELGVDLEKVTNRSHMHRVEDTIRLHQDALLQLRPTEAVALSNIWRSYTDAVAAYEQREAAVYQKITIHGETFNNPEINRFIVALYAGNRQWNDLDDEYLTIPVFNAEWRRFYQLMRNDDPLSTLGWRRHVASAINRIVDRGASEFEEGDTDENDHERYTVLFSALDTYLDIPHIQSEHVPVIMDLLMQAIDCNKESWDAFSDPVDEIDRRIHEYRDTSSEDLISQYMESRLEPVLENIFQKFKYDAAIASWEESNPDYSDDSEIRLPEDQLLQLYTQAKQYRSVDVPIHAYDRETLPLPISEKYIAMYSASDAFYVFKQDEAGSWCQVSIEDFLITNGVEQNQINASMVAKYRSLMDLRVRAHLEQAGIPITELNARQQCALLAFMERCTREEFDQVLKVIQSFDAAERTKVCTVFLATEVGTVPLDHLLSVLRQPDAVPLVDQIYELIGQTQTLEHYLHEQVTLAYTPEDIAAVYTRLIERVRSVLQRAVGDGAQHVQQAIEELQASQHLLLATLKTFGRSDRIPDLREIKDIDTGEVPAEQVSPADREAMIRLYRENYQEHPALSDALVAGLENVFSGERSRATTFFLLHHTDAQRNEQLRAYYRLETKDDGHLYFGSFNVDPGYRGSSIGNFILQQSLAKEAAVPGRIIEADCIPTASISQTYIEQGFVGFAINPDYHGVSLLKIYRNDGRVRELFASKNFSQEEIVRREVQGVSDGQYVIRSYPAHTMGTVSFDLLTQRDASDQYVLTRYFTSGSGPEARVFTVFEKVPTETVQQFTTVQHDHTVKSGV